MQRFKHRIGRLSVACALLLSAAHATAAEPSKDAEQRAGFFYNMITRSQGNFFRGNAMNFSIFNLSLVMDIMFSPPLTPTSPFTFNLATNGNTWHKDYEAVVFPVSGRIVFEITEENGQLKHFIGPDGEDVTFPVGDMISYMVESRASYNERLRRQEILSEKIKDPIYEARMGPLFAIMSGGLNRMNIYFFHVGPDTKTLIPSGVFSGKSIRPVQ